jgi:hypothetical protein
MDAATSETTQDWSLPVGKRPPLIGELEERIELALVTARASEAAVMTVGAAALDAAEQARRAAELAERASLAVARAPLATAAEAPVQGTEGEPAAEAASESKGEPGERSLSDFSERADRLVARLRQLQRIPLAAPAATSDAAAR